MINKSGDGNFVISIKKSSLLLLTILLVVVISGSVMLIKIFLNSNKSHAVSEIITIKTANAAEIYPEFICGCCGKPLDPNNICCGDMKQKIAYIDRQVSKGLSHDDVMLMAAKNFGFDSLAKEETKKSIKSKLAEKAPINSPKIIVDKENYDFGKISQANGIVSAELSIKNEGKSNLVIDKLTTSCGCTSASIIYRGKEGPTFTMPGHGKENPTNWSVSVAPGEEAKLKVYYDPNAHGKQKESTLSVTRTVDIFSNDPVNFGKRIKIELEQVP